MSIKINTQSLKKAKSSVYVTTNNIDNLVMSISSVQSNLDYRIKENVNYSLNNIITELKNVNKTSIKIVDSIDKVLNSVASVEQKNENTAQNIKTGAFVDPYFEYVEYMQKQNPNYSGIQGIDAVDNNAIENTSSEGEFHDPYYDYVDYMKGKDPNYPGVNGIDYNVENQTTQATSGSGQDGFVDPYYQYVDYMRSKDPNYPGVNGIDYNVENTTTQATTTSGQDGFVDPYYQYVDYMRSKDPNYPGVNGIDYDVESQTTPTTAGSGQDGFVDPYYQYVDYMRSKNPNYPGVRGIDYDVESQTTSTTTGSSQNGFVDPYYQYVDYMRSKNPNYPGVNGIDYNVENTTTQATTTSGQDGFVDPYYQYVDYMRSKDPNYPGVKGIDYDVESQTTSTTTGSSQNGFVDPYYQYVDYMRSKNPNYPGVNGIDYNVEGVDTSTVVSQNSQEFHDPINDYTAYMKKKNPNWQGIPGIDYPSNTDNTETVWIDENGVTGGETFDGNTQTIWIDGDGFQPETAEVEEVKVPQEELYDLYKDDISKKADQIYDLLKEIEKDPSKKMENYNKINKLIDEIFDCGLSQEQLKRMLPTNYQKLLGFIVLSDQEMAALKKLGYTGENDSVSKGYLSASEYERYVSSNSQFSTTYQFLNNLNIDKNSKKSLTGMLLNCVSIASDGSVKFTLNNNLNASNIKFYVDMINNFLVENYSSDEVKKIVKKLLEGKLTAEEERALTKNYYEYINRTETVEKPEVPDEKPETKPEATTETPTETIPEVTPEVPETIPETTPVTPTETETVEVTDLSITLTAEQSDILESLGFTGKDGKLHHLTVADCKKIGASNSEYKLGVKFIKNLNVSEEVKNALIEELAMSIEITKEGITFKGSKNLNKLTIPAYTNAVNDYWARKLSDKELIELLSKIANGTMTTQEEIDFLSGYLKDGFYEEGKDTCFNRIYDAIQSSLTGETLDDAMFNLRALAVLAKDTEFALEARGGYTSKNKISLNKWVNSSGSAMHEFGHLIHINLCDSISDMEWDRVIAGAQKNGNRNVNDLYNMQTANKKNIYARDAEAKKKIGTTKYNEDAIRKKIKTYDLDRLQSYYGLSDESLDSIRGLDLTDSYTENQLIDIIIDELESGKLSYARRNGPEAAMSNIVSAIYQTQNLNIGGIDIPITYHHDDAYWTSGTNKVLKEVMADYNDLKMWGAYDEIKQLRNIFGDELFDTLDRIYATAEVKP